LQNVHGWVAKQAISVDVNQSISITAALQEAQQRVLNVVDVEAISEDTSMDRRVSSGHLADQRVV
jgi:ketopantoate hydroxymethyltransferase